MTDKGWVVKATKQPMVLETVDLGPLGAEDVEVAVEHCGVCHSDLSVLNNARSMRLLPISNLEKHVTASSSMQISKPLE